MVGVKKRLLLLFLPVTIIFLLTGCRNNEQSMEAEGLPEGTRLNYLVRTPELKTPDEWKGTELGEYNEDDWHGVYNIEVGGRHYASEYDSVRVAVIDEDGKIYKISPEFSLRFEGKNYYWSEKVYNYDENRITGVKVDLLSTRLSSIHTMSGVISFYTLVLLSIFILALSPNGSKDYPFIAILLNIPAIVSVACAFVEAFSKYYSPPNGFENDEEFTFCFEFCVFFLLNFIGVQRYLKCRQKRLSEIDARIAPPDHD